jgi:apolipoprotein N-acyltransferase
MKLTGPRLELAIRYALAIGAGTMLALAFPKVGAAQLAWLAPVVLLAAAMGQRGGAAFRLGYAAGLVQFLVSLHWLLFIPVPVAPLAGWLSLAAFLALFPAAWVWLCWELYPARLRNGTLTALGLLDRLVSTGWPTRAAWTFACAAIWVALEMVRARVLGGFPWNLLGVSQVGMLPLIQVAAFTGVYGVSFLMVWFSVALLGTVALVLRRPEAARWNWSRELTLPLLAVLGTMSYGLGEVFRAERPPASLKLALIQPSIPQTVIWDPREAAARFARVIELSEQALTNQVDVLMWPEAAVPSLFRWDTNQVYRGQTLYEALTGLARRHRVWLVMGADDAEPRRDGSGDADFFNSSFLINPQGEVLASYRKRHLVIFGEYVPLARWLPFLRRFTQVSGDFTPGQGPVPFHLADLRVKAGVLICFEDIFPHLARGHVDDDTDLLLNLTNNGWFGESAAQWQHAAAAAFRAVENGLPLVRAANNGLSCWVDPRGRMHAVHFPDSTDIYQAGFKVVQVPLAVRRAGSGTFYWQHGDWFGWSCVALAAVSLAWVLVKRRRAAPLNLGSDV